MHEMGIANSILEAVTQELSRHPTARATKVGVRIGELAALDAESLRFCFEALSRDTKLEGLQLETEFCPRRHHCGVCDVIFDIRDYEFCCPRCGTSETKCISGEELELAYLEVEEYEPNAIGTKSSQ
jgi:hydrogenase nickel incorporation protein HypA/HybF